MTTRGGLALCRHCGNTVAADSGREATLLCRTVPPNSEWDLPGCGPSPTPREHDTRRSLWPTFLLSEPGA